jgi:Sulfotransferase domain
MVGGSEGSSRVISRLDYRVGYIGGSGRSGSTILDMMLGGNSHAFSAGQLDDLRLWLDTGGYCTCGQSVEDCPFWKEVLKNDGEVVPPAMNVSSKIGKVTRTLRVVASGLTAAEAPEVERAWALLDRVAERSGTDVVVDSSKSALRVARLARHPMGKRLRLVHLIRDARGYVTSKSFSTRVEGPQGAAGYTMVQSKPAAVADWLAQNLLTLTLGFVAFRGRYLVLTYEQLTRSPERILDRLAEFLDMKYEPSMLPPLSRHDFHLIGGNSSRLDFSELRHDDSWRRKLTPREAFLIRLTTGWLYALLARLAARHERARDF